MACPDADMFGALVAGAVPSSVRAAIANHAGSCETCHALLAGLELPPGPTDGDGELDDESTALEIKRGTHVGRYVIETRLGAGGMGVVFAAMDSELHRRVAVKVLRPDKHEGAGRERLLREARTLARLSHPNVVTVFDVGTHQGLVFLAMELVEGGNLTAWLGRAPRMRDEIIDRMIEAGRGLAAAHGAGIVHRDVKPDNILVGSDGRARMTDFGLAHLGDSGATISVATSDGVERVALAETALTHTGTLFGTPAYMAPEQQARAETSAQSDQWSFCATLHEAVTGVRPPATGRRISRGMRQLVQRGLANDPAARWPSMDIVVRRLVRLRHRRRTLAAVTVAILVTAAALWLAFGKRSAPPPRPQVLVPTYGPSLPGITDDRAGCNCPYSACDHRCLSVCDASEFALGPPVPGLDVTGRQEVLSGVALDGDTILYLAGEHCNRDHLYLARRHGDTFESLDLTPQLDLSRVAVFEGCCTIAPDGRSLVVAASDQKSFLRAQIVGDKLSAFDTSELAQLIPPPIGAREIRFPVFGADGLTLYYHLYDPDGNRGVQTSLEGNFVATRADLRSPFTQAHRLEGRARVYEYVSGVSSDGLTLFLQQDFDTVVLVRPSTDVQFDPPGPSRPGRIYGWRATPLADCSRLVTTSSPGGCEQEQIIYLDAVKRPPLRR